MQDRFLPVFGYPLAPWFRWFAWHPVKTEDRGWRWLRFVWRRRCATKVDLPGGYFTWFQSVVEKD